MKNIIFLETYIPWSILLKKLNKNENTVTMKQKRCLLEKVSFPHQTPQQFSPCLPGREELGPHPGCAL